MNKTEEEALNLAKEVLQDIERGSVQLSNVARKAKRLTILLGDEIHGLWLDMEMYGLQGLPTEAVRKKGSPEMQKAASLFSETRSIRNPVALTDEILDRLSDLSDLESVVQQVTLKGKDSLAVASLASLEQPRTNFELSFGRLTNTELKVALVHMLNDNEITEVVEKIRNRIYDYASRTYKQLGFAEIIETIFTEYRRVVDEKLTALYPDAFEKLTAAYNRLRSDSAEERSQAVLSCRRLLKAFADAFYPARSEMVNGHTVDDENYINRLWAFMKERIASESNRELVQADLNDLGTRIDKLNELASKGVHSTISKEEAGRIVIHTYLVLGDIIRLTGV